MRHKLLQKSTYRRQHRNEELAAVRVGPRIGHAHRVRPIVLQRRHKFILEVTAPNRLAASARAGRIARLHHEPLDDAMENVPIVVARFAVHAKVLDRFGALGGKQFHVHVAQRCVNGGRTVDTLDAYNRIYTVLIKDTLFNILIIYRINVC